jgi:hypothetical protein
VARSVEELGERLRRTTRSADLARRLGIDLPIFRGPLIAFDPGQGRCPGESVCLGGDLHAIHPDTRGPAPPSDRDESLDLATVAVFDGEGWSLDIPANEGVWCICPEEVAPDCTPYFSLTDGRGRLRAWLILPGARTMIGIGPLWLPRPGRRSA